MIMRKHLILLALLALVVFASSPIGQSSVVFVSRIVFGTASSGVTIRSSTGTPEAAVTAPIGSLFLRSDGGAGTALYVKESGSGNTGWVTLPGATVTASSTNTFTNKTIDAEGTGNVITIPFGEWWPAAVCQDGGYAALWDFGANASSHRPTPSCQQSDPALTYTTADFLDTQTDYIYHHFLLPSDWTGTITFDIYWFTTATSGNAVWQVQTSCTALTETIAPASISFNAAQTVTDAANGTASTLNLATISSLTTTGCSAGELMWLKMFRDPAHASDTIGATAAFIGSRFTYRRAL